MSDKSHIEWTEATWNPTVGCSRVSEGCRNCYAEVMAWRHVLMCRALGRTCKYEGTVDLVNGEPRWTGVLRLDPDSLVNPLHWKRPRRIFVNSMSDLFHEKLSDEDIDRVFAVMALTPQHTFQVLTKRAERMRDYTNNRDNWRRLTQQIFETVSEHGLDETLLLGCIEELRVDPQDSDKQCWVVVPLPNVWLGVSAEDQKTADERIPWLLKTPAAVRWVSYEPALGPVDFHKITHHDGDGPSRELLWIGEGAGIDWVVVGGESGPRARPFDLQWARDVVRQCKAAGVACFVKQLGAFPFWEPTEFHEEVEGGPLRLLSRKGGDIEEWPSDLRIREYPAGR